MSLVIFRVALTSLALKFLPIFSVQVKSEYWI